jgi:release factor glutamine methyltransferase
MHSLRHHLDQATLALSAAPHSERARADAELLLLHLLCKNRAWLMAHRDDELAEDKAAQYIERIERRCAGEPIQYIHGETEFYGLPIRVTPNVLIPRPETEHLVEKAIELATHFAAPRVVDVGTGSGCIAIAIARNLQRPAEHSVKGTGFSPYKIPAEKTGALAPEEDPSVSFSPPPIVTMITAVDLSGAALAVAEENAKRNSVSLRFLEGDLLSPVAGERFEIIVSNPPYVPTADRATLSVEVRDHEPALALFAGDDGLDLYGRLIPAAFDALVSGGYLLLEIGFGQTPAIGELLARCGFAQIEFTPDLQGIPRVACARRP